MVGANGGFSAGSPKQLFFFSFVVRICLRFADPLEGKVGLVHSNLILI